MNGAESLVTTLLGGGIDVCFANPGTSEMHFVAALDRIPGMRCVLGLQENVVTGAADGYWRITDRPSVTLLHCGAGLANGLANLHNAHRAHSGIVNVVGDMATYHHALNSPLTADTTGWGRSVSGFLRVSANASRVGADAADAIAAARAKNGQIATLVMPADTAWTEGGIAGRVAPTRPVPHPAPEIIRDIAKILRSGEPALLLIGGRNLRSAPLRDAYRIMQTTGARLLAPTANARITRGAGRPLIDRLPYPIELSLRALSGFAHIILVESTAPVAFFAYPGKPGSLIPQDCQVHVLASQEENGPAALAALAEQLVAPTAIQLPSAEKLHAGTGAVTPEALGHSICALLPQDAVVIDEGQTFGRAVFGLTHGAAPHDWLHITGSAIGIGPPMATGAAIGAPGRRVVSLQADGSALFTLQALWTQAREKLDVTTILFANRKYQILLGELAAVGANAGRTALDMMDIGNPDIDWVALANSLGVAAARAESMEQFNDLFASSLSHSGPFLIELVCN